MNRIRIIIKISGIRCAGCLNSIERVLTKYDIEKFEYDFYSSIGSIWYQGNIEDEFKYLNAIQKSGYEVLKIASYNEKTED